jgi:hypothetical protein
MWQNITVNMLPPGYWTKQKISNIAKTWNPNRKELHDVETEELRLAKILPAECKPTDIDNVINKQTHLSPEERKQLRDVLLDFGNLFQGKCGDSKGDPITLELLPNSTPFYGKPFSIPKAYQQITKNEIARLE